MIKKQKAIPKKQIVVTGFAPVINQVSVKNTKRLMLLIISVFALVLYGNTLTHSYTVDDGTVMQNNKIVKKGISAIPEILTTRYRQGFWERKENLYRPLSLVMFSIEWQLAPEKPLTGHLINILLYALTGILLFNTLVKLLPGKNFIIPFITSLLFIAHPLHTEVIANIKSRDEILSLLFILGSVNALAGYIHTQKIKSVIFSLACFFLALLAKENALTFMAAVPLIIYFFSDYSLKKNMKISALFAVIVVLYLAIRASVLGSMGNETELQIINNSLLGAPDLAGRLATAVYILGKYLFLLLIPFSLTFDYSYNQIPVISFFDFKAILSAAVHIALIIYAIKKIREKNLKSFGILFYFITISLVSNVLFLIESTMAERFLYMPSLGFCLATALWLTEIFKADTTNKGFNFSQMFQKHKSLTALLTIILFLYSVKTISRNADWKDNLTLLAHDVKAAPKSARIQYAYGSALLLEQALKEKDQDRKNALLDKSIEHLEKGVAILNTYSDAFFHLGIAYKEKGDYTNAIKNFEAARKNKKFNEEDFYVASGIAYGSAKRFDEAIADLNVAVQLNPQSAEAYNNLGLYSGEKGDFENALKHLNTAIKLKPDFDKAFYNLGNVYAKTQDFATAITYYKKAIAVDPLYKDAWNNLGNSHAALKDYDNAITSYKKVIEMDPYNVQVLYNIGITYKITGNHAEGDKYLEKVKQIKTNI